MIRFLVALILGFMAGALMTVIAIVLQFQQVWIAAVTGFLVCFLFSMIREDR